MCPPSIQRTSCEMVGTLRFAHPTIFTSTAGSRSLLRSRRPCRRDRRELLVVVPRPLAVGRLLHLHQVHVVEHAAVAAPCRRGEDVVDRHLVQLRRDRLGLVGAGGLDRLQVLGAAE